MDGIETMVGRLQGGVKNPERYASVDGAFIPWTRKVMIQARIDALERKLENMKALHLAKPA